MKRRTIKAPTKDASLIDAEVIDAALIEKSSDLWQSRQQGSLRPFPEQALSVAQAYQLQAACTQVSQEKICGYKIGATSDETLGILGLSEPFYGSMFASYTSYTTSGQLLKLPLHAAHNPRVEAEFVACIKSPVRRGDKDIELHEILEHIDWVAPGFEFVGSRYTPTDGSPGTSVIGDFGAHQHSVIGAPCMHWQAQDLQHHPVSVMINGVSVASGHSGMSIYGHPLEFVCWLLNHPDMAQGLEPGQLVSCGTCSGAIAVKAGDMVKADYGAMGALKVIIDAA